MSNNRIIKTYVWHGEQCFFVSTINRESSAVILPALRYNETIVWTYNWEGDNKGLQEIIWQGEDRTGSIRTHQRIVELLHDGGAEKLKESDL